MKNVTPLHFLVFFFCLFVGLFKFALSSRSLSFDFANLHSNIQWYDATFILPSCNIYTHTSTFKIECTSTRKSQSNLVGRNSSVGRALDWRSKGPWFKPGFRQYIFWKFENAILLKIQLKVDEYIDLIIKIQAYFVIFNTFSHMKQYDFIL